jgi:iron(III) transport system ATP-binding protein
MSMSERKQITIRDLRKSFRRLSSEEVIAVNGVSLHIEPGELLVLLGPSGCGKTTLLRCIAGLEEPSGGQIEIGGDVVYASPKRINVRTNRRDVPMIFQSYALWPHMTVAGNVRYPLESRGYSSAVMRAKVSDVLKLVGLEHLADEYPGTISGGQQQRVALARALITDPAVILFDEPLSNIDAQVRSQLRLEIKSMHRRVGFAAVYVTHDQEEALALATRIAVMDRGKVVQLGTPQEIYDRPATKYVAEFVGRANTIDATIQSVRSDPIVLDTPVGMIRLPAANCPSDIAEGQPLTVIVRPEDVELCFDGDNGSPRAGGICGRIESVEFLGTRYAVAVEVNGTTLRVSHGRKQQPGEVGQPVILYLDPTLVRAVTP